MTSEAPRAGAIDWVARWSAMQSEVSREARDGDASDQGPGDAWAHRAASFDRMSRAWAESNALPTALAPHLKETDVVIDIGAGTGRHTVLFARHCRRVIAIEPSAAMRVELERRVQEEQLGNVEVLGARWPMAGGPRGDLVFSSHVLYGIDDVAAFLAAMEAASFRSCALLLGLKAPSSALDPLRRHLDGTEPAPRPAALEALNVLHQLGMQAELALVQGSRRTFEVGPSDEDAAALCPRLRIRPTAENVARVREGLAAIAPCNPSGNHVLGTTGPNALLSWLRET
jgi:hypothetical protein